MIARQEEIRRGGPTVLLDLASVNSNSSRSDTIIVHCPLSIVNSLYKSQFVRLFFSFYHSPLPFSTDGGLGGGRQRFQQNLPLLFGENAENWNRFIFSIVLKKTWVYNNIVNWKRFQN